MKFRLFAAPLTDAADNGGPGTCFCCHREATTRYVIAKTDTVVMVCANCGAENGCRADSAEKRKCSCCGTCMTFAALKEEDAACGVCLADGRIAMVHVTEAGEVSWETVGLQAAPAVLGEKSAVKGHAAAPELPRPEHIAIPGGTMTQTTDEWAERPADISNLDTAACRELLHTPRFSSWQETSWLVCCRAPMTYLGAWSREQFHAEAEDGDGRRLFEQIIDDGDAQLWNFAIFENGGVYVFGCTICKCRRACWDMS